MKNIQVITSGEIIQTITSGAEAPAELSQVLQLANDADPLAVSLEGVERIELHFPKFTDGRAFSQAFLLRRRLGFQGDIRATGDVLIDQALFMRRCGFDAYEIADAAKVPRFVEAFKTFSVFYQPAGDGRAPVSALRRFASAGRV